MTWDRFVATVLTCSVLLAGCTGMQRIPPATAPGQPVYGPLKPGDTVVVHTRAGEQGPFVIERIDGETLVAHGGTRFTRQDILRLERHAISGPRTAILIGGIAAGAIMLAVGAWLTGHSR
jgi:hypothetical protein